MWTRASFSSWFTCHCCWWGIISSPFYVGAKTCLGTVVYLTIRANFVWIFLKHTQNHTKTHEETAREMNGWNECKRVYQRDDLLHDNQLLKCSETITLLLLFNNGQANQGQTEKETEIGSKTPTSFLFIFSLCSPHGRIRMSIEPYFINNTHYFQTRLYINIKLS